jgi:hypothetical protein
MVNKKPIDQNIFIFTNLNDHFSTHSNERVLQNGYYGISYQKLYTK